MNTPTETAFPPAPDLDYMGLLFIHEDGTEVYVPVDENGEFTIPEEITSKLGLWTSPEQDIVVHEKASLNDWTPPSIEIGWAWEEEEGPSGQEEQVADILEDGPPPDGVLVPPSKPGERTAYVTGTGGIIGNPHTAGLCTGRHCVIHNPSDHLMRDFPTHFRFDRYLMERICPHGVGHPDPDDRAWQEANLPERAPSVHGCDGCCAGAYDHIPVTVPPKYDQPVDEFGDPAPESEDPGVPEGESLRELIASVNAATMALGASAIKWARGLRA